MVHSTSSFRSVILYGVEHSPWVQGVRLALAHHNIPTHLTSYPLSLSWFWNNGPVFPALKLADKSIHVDSFRIYELLEESGFSVGLHTKSEAERSTDQLELELLFSNYAVGRVMNGRQWAFIQGWSTMREDPHTVLGVIWRALLVNYFWVLINLGIRIDRKKRRIPYDLNQFEQQIRRWNDRLDHSSWLTGPDIGFLDFALLGQIQCMTSGLTDELLPVLQRQPHLMRWLRNILEHFSEYQPVYARRLLEESSYATATPSSRLLFWVAWTGWILFFPVTLLVIVASLQNRFKNPARSGAIISRQKKSTTDRSPPPKS